MQEEIKYGQLWARHSELVVADQVGNYRISFEGMKRAIEEVLRMQHPGSNVWVKMSDRLPDKDGYYHVRKKPKKPTETDKDLQYYHSETKRFSWDNVIEWLDESNEQPVEQISQDAHEKEVMMQAFGKVRQIFEGRSWIMEGRGSYPYNDDRYREEVRYLYDEFDAIKKETWGNIKSKSFEYRQAIIAEYLKSEQKENDAFAFEYLLGELQARTDRILRDKGCSSKEVYDAINDVAHELYNEYQKQKNGQ
jgi:hypothetical protein